MGRPKGIKDKTKRKNKVILNSTQEKAVILDYENGLASHLIKQKYNISKSTLSKTLSTRNVKIKLNQTSVAKWEMIENIDNLDKDVVGIYAILFEWSDKTDSRAINNNLIAYIGSSVCIKNRIKTHLSDAMKGKHYNNKFINYTNNSKYNIKLFIIERCEEQDLLKKEGVWINSVSSQSLINKNSIVKKEDIEPWLKAAISYKSYTQNHYTDNNKQYNGSLCKCSDRKRKGYGVMVVRINGVKKYLTKHRIAYWEKNGEYPELIRHLCNNSECYNADHLAEGSYRDNGLDKRGDFPKVFTEKWKELGGNVIELTKEFGWKPNMKINKNLLASSSVYDWEKKLKLRTKYPEVIKNRSFHKKLTEEEKNFLKTLLKYKTFKQIRAIFIKKYNNKVSRKTIQRLGGCLSGVPENKNNEIYDFVKQNLDLYCDTELCGLVNMKFGKKLSLDRFMTLRFKKNLYRCELKPEKQLVKKDTISIFYNAEVEEFIKVNHTKYTDEEMAIKALNGRLLDNASLLYCYGGSVDLVEKIRAIKKDMKIATEN